MASDNDATDLERQKKIKRIFRRECLITDAELRVDVANEVLKTVIGNESISLESKSIVSKGNASVIRGNRERIVNGNYHSQANSVSYKVTGSVTETVTGNVNQFMKFEAEHIIAGSYNALYRGAYIRTSVWTDFLIWGGWLEVDVLRIEMTGMAIKSYAVYNHAIGARITLAGAFVDDQTFRNEYIGAAVLSAASKGELRAPGGGQVMEV